MCVLFCWNSEPSAVHKGFALYQAAGNNTACHTRKVRQLPQRRSGRTPQNSTAASIVKRDTWPTPCCTGPCAVPSQSCQWTASHRAPTQQKDSGPDTTPGTRPALHSVRSLARASTWLMRSHPLSACPHHQTCASASLWPGGCEQSSREHTDLTPPRTGPLPGCPW